MNCPIARRRLASPRLRLLALLGLACLLAVPAAQAAPVGVKPGDTFHIAVTGYNVAAGKSAYLTTLVDPVFGTTATFTGDALGGQVLTVTSSETTSGSTVTDHFTISVPTNFDPSGTTIGGAAVTQMDALLGGGYIGTDYVDLTAPLVPTSFTPVGNMIYSGGTFNLSPFDAFSNGNQSYSLGEGVNAGGSDLASFNIHSFSFTTSYTLAPAAAGAPEPSEWAAIGFTGLGIGGLLLRARKRKASAA